MKTNLDLVDGFQQRFGEKAAFARARDFMWAYISEVRAPLPPLAAKGLEVARKVREGTATLEERTGVLAEMWDYIVKHEGSRSSPAPECCIMRAISSLIRDHLGPGENEYASELVGWFFSSSTNLKIIPTAPRFSSNSSFLWIPRRSDSKETWHFFSSS